MFPVPSFLASPLIPFVAAGSVAGVAYWPTGLQIAIWFALAALVGSSLGIWRERRTSGEHPVSTPVRKSVRRRPLLHHA